MALQHYASYEDMYDTVVNVERATKEKNEFYNKQRGMKRSWDQCGNPGYQQTRSDACLGVVCSAYGKLGHDARKCRIEKWCFLAKATCIK